MDPTQLAMSRFAEGCNCAQSVVSAYAGSLGLDDETALKIAAGFGGGMGRMAETCGVVTGAFMVLGLKYATAASDPETKDRVYSQVKEFADRFRARAGSIVCRDLLGCDISSPEGRLRAREENLHQTLCSKFVQDACTILNEMLAP